MGSSPIIGTKSYLGENNVTQNRATHYDNYSEYTEIVPGVFYEPGDAVYIVDDEGEVISWNCDEWADDTDAITATITAVVLATKRGAMAVRTNINGGGAELIDLIEETYKGP